MNEKLISTIPLFQSVEATSLAVIASHSRSRQYVAGERILHQGDLASSFGIIARGLVKVHMVGDGGIDTILALCGPAELIGEISAFDGLARSADVTAMVDTQVVEIPADALRCAISQSDRLAWDLLAAMAARIRRLTDTTVTLATSQLLTRVASNLLTFAKAIGRRATDEERRMLRRASDAPRDIVTIELPVTQTEFASFCGGSRESVSRILSSLRSAGIIAQASKGNKNLIIDVAKLRPLAHADESD